MSGDLRYDFPVVAASKVIIRQGGKILFTREPLENSWMPGRLGLPGGKYFLNEGIFEGTRRKIDNETGVQCELRGLFKVVQILMPEKTVYHYIFVADFVSGDTNTKSTWSDELRWLSPTEIKFLSVDDVTEYYFPELLKEYFINPEKFSSLDFIKEQPSFRDSAIQEWMRKGSKETK